MVLVSNTDVIITGNSRSPDFPTNNFPANSRFHAGPGNADAFLVRFSFATDLLRGGHVDGCLDVFLGNKP